MELYYWMILWNYITGSYYGIILRNDLMESYSGIIFVKRIPRMPATAPEPLGIPGNPLGRPLGPPGDAPGTPRDASGTLGGAPLMDYTNSHISTNFQRQKLSITVFEPAHEGPSHAALNRAVFSSKTPPK